MIGQIVRQIGFKSTAVFSVACLCAGAAVMAGDQDKSPREAPRVLSLRDAAVGRRIADAAEQHIAILLSAHDMNPLLPVMDRVVYLADGRAASGTTDQVVRTDTLSRLYGHHVEVIHVQGRVLVVSGAEHQAHHDAGPDPFLRGA